MKVLVIGSGGREHTICWAIKQSPKCDALFCAPGNAGISEIATCLGNVGVDDHEAIISACQDFNIDFVFVGPEVPLCNGLIDELKTHGILGFGPSKLAAELEGSKKFMKDICAKYNIPTAGYKAFTNVEEAKEYAKAKNAPMVVKADGLAAGKGVVVATELQDALDAIVSCLESKEFGEAGSVIVIEDMLYGEEASFFTMHDGAGGVVILGSAQDHKRIGDGDIGPNTGGMGSYSPTALITEEMTDYIMNKIVLPMDKAMRDEGRPFAGIMFSGLMIDNGKPELLEINTRFGDPETQVVVPRMKTDLLSLLHSAARGKMLEEYPTIELHEKAAMCVVMAAKGYPKSYVKGTPISNLDKAGDVDGVTIFHAGTAKNGEQIVAAGGRVLGVVALADTLKDAKDKAYEAVDLIDWEDGYCRRDIGWRAFAK
ncbi:MAG: phosphoribosylamine--glycine ligase [Alphaproteobacteria bacterium]|nr:phosphoribosylamine--glycine ligase [Alphaproteobacteria bacterium]